MEAKDLGMRDDGQGPDVVNVALKLSVRRSKVGTTGREPIKKEHTQHHCKNYTNVFVYCT